MNDITRRRLLLGLVAAAPAVVFGIKKLPTVSEVKTVFPQTVAVGTERFDIFTNMAGSYMAIAKADVVVAYVGNKLYKLKNRWGETTKEPLPRKPDCVMAFYRYPTPGWKILDLKSFTRRGYSQVLVNGEVQYELRRNA